MDNLLDLTTAAPLPLFTLVVNLLLSILLASALAWFYTRYGKSLSNRARFAHTLPLLAVITTLVISIVKSSLALSLGLVGALSIVRFRTAIKEPEELLFLFAAIAIGLGMGADQRLATIVAVLVMLAYMFIRTLATPNRLKNNLYLNVLAPSSDNSFSQINQLLLKHVESADLRRLDRNGTTLQATYLIACPNEQVLVSLMDEMSSQISGSELSFVEQDNTFGA
jgi:ribose/xylose/arabinose/galactoside ABC-type transport system permease subunit